MNLIKNGSFEKAAKGSSPPTGNGEPVGAGESGIAGWTVFGGLSGDGVAWLPNGNTYGVTTPFGSDFLDLTGYHDGQPYFGVEQTIKTVKGTRYDLTFHLGVDNSSNIYDGPISVTAAAGSTNQNFDYDPKKSGNQWGSFTLEFTATSSTTQISIQGLSGDQYIGLDQVAVSAVKEEPAISPSRGSVSAFVGAMAALGGFSAGAVHPSALEAPHIRALARPHAAAF
jgi:hypothetical protein